MPDGYLEVIDEEGTVIGRELRTIVHRMGLPHREVHVWFMTSTGQIFLQRRSSSKDTFPLLLDATVGGHVEEGASFIETALVEVHEETGVRLSVSDLVHIATVKARDVDPVRGTVNNALRAVYLHMFDGDVEDLEVEAEDGGGFEIANLADVFARDGQWLQELVPALLEAPYSCVWQALSEQLTKDATV